MLLQVGVFTELVTVPVKTPERSQNSYASKVKFLEYIFVDKISHWNDLHMQKKYTK